MQEAHEQRRQVTNGASPQPQIPTPRGRTVSRIYEQQATFLRDVPRRERQGWRLVGTRQQPASIPLEVIRASAPGALLHGSRDRVVAYYTCVSGAGRRRSLPFASTVGHFSYQTRLTTGAWLERLAHAIQPPCYPE